MSERISEAEWQVMEVLWHTSPLTAQDVAARLVETGWSLPTVKTLLSRLAAKGALATTEDGRRYLYEPAVERAAVAAGESRRLVDRLFGGRATPLVAHLAERGELSPADIAELEALIRELKQ
ncbi:CopY family transcriptional repressor [Sphingomonas sp. IBVSS1]|jgi:predicted transcriptional regulator|uniref:CopY family transcriptional repressor n=1 Tax=Sandarakinorhabdus cyanobacteriorum TaxID=1981098 RepID=A0A255YGC6_9SPHN|nr:BlaI/MecI/CopY family transcriptional regulator [Sandarakinorhabdus cyanobacteriorum]OSZ69104.1 CopY family transcriptional repressor [Sphingomonas sp. IBVSS1]OYQ27625.1 CopY family transcriptional repressor [Sandarakinorhabdus cyanobacteriorum]